MRPRVYLFLQEQTMWQECCVNAKLTGIGTPGWFQYTQPGYIDNPPAVINIDTGRQLFVDNFLIDSNASKNIETAYHTPQYRQDNPGGEIVDIYCLTEEGCCVLDVHFVAVALLVYCFCGASSS
eukprot:m.1077431 g.1077431  ORF g.1077431 m.1077431 type:complete len:124 (+) comp24251_c0_seq37:414-785(+)